MRKVILINDKNFTADYSIKSGKSDGQKHFDHHGDFSEHVAPCRSEMPIAEEKSTIQISHMDADTFVGLLKFYGADLPEVCFESMEKIDLNGSSVVDRYDPTLLYMVGVGEMARGLKFPRSTEKPQDVTELVEAMMAKTGKETARMGEDATDRSEEVYVDREVGRDGKVGWWSIGENDPLDPSRPYEDGIEIVVVYREHYKSISVYCDPKSSHDAMSLGIVEEIDGIPLNYKATIGGYRMCGHPKAVGSERTENGWDYGDSRNIFWAVVEKVNGHSCPRCGEYVKTSGGYIAGHEGLCNGCYHRTGIQLCEAR